MALITFTSDFGIADHYVAAVKARILSFNPNLKVVDITHHIEPYNISHASFVVSGVFRDFPKGTIHIIAVNSMNSDSAQNVVMKLEDHFFIAPNNGVLSLLSKNESGLVIEINHYNGGTTFPARDIYGPAAARLASGGNLHDLGMQNVTLKKLIGRQVKATKKQITGHVIRVDGYGNLITNIEYNDFTILSKGRKYKITFGREWSRSVHNDYDDVEPGDCFLLFNSLGLLEIGIRNGNASELLGIELDSAVNILFEDEESKAE